jgi:hypothetical protein
MLTNIGQKRNKKRGRPPGSKNRIKKTVTKKKRPCKPAMTSNNNSGDDISNNTTDDLDQQGEIDIDFSPNCYESVKDTDPTYDGCISEIDDDELSSFDDEELISEIDELNDFELEEIDEEEAKYEEQPDPRYDNSFEACEYVQKWMKYSDLHVLQPDKVKNAWLNNGARGLFNLYCTRNFLTNNVQNWVLAGLQLKSTRIKALPTMMFDAYIGLELAASIIGFNCHH